jgi:hypothetical protein
MGHSKHYLGSTLPILQPWHGPRNTQLITGLVSFILSLPSAFSSSYGRIMITDNILHLLNWKRVTSLQIPCVYRLTWHVLILSNFWW